MSKVGILLVVLLAQFIYLDRNGYCISGCNQAQGQGAVQTFYWFNWSPPSGRSREVGPFESRRACEDVRQHLPGPTSMCWSR